jgi:hypothetical protein
MNILYFRKFLLFAVVLSCSIVICEAQSFDRPPAPKQSKRISTRGPLKTKTVKVKGPKAVERAKKEQVNKDKKRKKDYERYVRENQKRSIAIQTPEVQARMKNNIKDADTKYKTKKKKSTSTTRRAANKYR